MKKDSFFEGDKLKIYTIGGIIGCVVSIVCMLIFAAVILFLQLDRNFAMPFATVSVAIGGFVAAYYAARKIGYKGYLTGLAVGGITFALVTVISLFINKSGLTANTVFHLVIIVLASTVGGIMGVNKGKSNRII